MSTDPAPSERFTRAELIGISRVLAALDFDTPFRIAPDTGIVTAAAQVWAPVVAHDDQTDVTIDGAGWEALTGLTGQLGYDGAVMHASEQMAGSWGIVAAMLDTQDGRDVVWSQVVVDVIECDENCESEPGETCEAEHEPAGWAIVYREGAATPCAYCRRPIPAGEQAAGPWHWPGRGVVVNCKRCASIVKGECGHEWDSTIYGRDWCPTCDENGEG